MIALLAVAASAGSFSESCPELLPLQRLVEEIDGAERHYMALEASAFSDAVDIVILALPCVGEPVPSTVAARYHVLMGLSWYVRGESAQARASLAAARAADPALSVSTSLIPEGHELSEWVRTAPPGDSTPVPEALDATLLFDGQQATERPTERPTIVQLVEPSGRTATLYLPPEEPMPPYPQRAPEAPSGGDPPHARKRWGWLAAGGVGLASSAVLYGLASRSASEFAGPLPSEYGRPELLALKNRTNLLVVGSLAAASVGGVGVVLFVAPRPAGGR